MNETVNKQYASWNKKKLNEFVGLLKIGSTEKIKTWKKNHHFIYDCGKLCNDVNVIFELNKNYNTGDFNKDIFNYVKYVDDEDPFNYAVKWISTEEKIEYLTNYTFFT
tara:strand:+ start:433 stop:756 length:324 start_codon:yes stop_codon:yes gene_type:complete